MGNVKTPESELQREAKRFCRGSVRVFRTDEDLLIRAHLLFRLCRARDEAAEGKPRRDLASLERRVRLRLHAILNQSRKTPLARKLHARPFTRLEREILLALACSALGMSDRVSDASDLIGVLRKRGPAGLSVLRALAPGGRLACSELLCIDRESTPLDHCVRLENKVLETLLRPLASRKPVEQKDGAERMLKPRLKLRDLVLPERVMEALRLALAQARQHGTLFTEWGLGRVFPYGRGMTLLFSGPPGVGKTAAAEALAGELRKRLLAANYSELVSCWLGVTEKNFARTFADARKADAVLFWDEADSLFYQRENTMRTWEVSSVNTLLQELERFEGVCVLATNRPVTLDKALRRRIAVKVEFERPDAPLRRKLWRKLLPKRLPLACDVCVEQLSEMDLSGGEIKNVVLNAARFALARAARGPVCMADFQAALRLEQPDAPSAATTGRMGFRTATTNA
jgi:AAA+ superfamily predicted ATPase